ncbi:hypothetical protein J2Z48_000378 [Croceifilum oryzae]|uniref:Uncharacterized protein n=1 Tax=Croceifilum oryzae TaxID=1553429 RepID=A0AAJ1TD53_9BACL|nr:hypothetical protein [Croceifilum oryzae]MDQ0416214.1 hypothetical protein [Croceifilum oryzae]
MSEIKFWYDESIERLIILNLDNQKRVVYRSKKRIETFLSTYDLALSSCKGVFLDVDRVGVFKAREREFAPFRWFRKTENTYSESVE